MGGDWKEFSIGTIAKVITGKTPPGTLEEYFDGETLFVTPTDMSNDKYITSTIRTLSSKGREIQNRIVFDKGIVVSCIGWQMGKSAIVNQVASTNQQINTVIPDASFINFDFLYYILKSKRQEIFDLGSTATRTPIIKKSLFEKITFKAPPLPEQKSIAHILGSLDDKIELNRRMNATLEGLAQALFQSWFVDFDPVLDNALAAGNPIPDELTDRATVRRQALNNGTANREAAQHFPATFQLTEELGWIPEGWDTKTIEELAEKVAMGPFGSSIKVSTFVEEGIPVISGQHLKNTLLEDSVFNFITPDHAEKLKRSNVFRGDIIFTHAGSIGQVSLIPPESKYDRYVISQRQFYLRCDLEKTSSLYLTYFFRSHDGQHVLLANASQVGVPSLARPSSYLKSIRVINPDKTILNLFDNFIRDIHTSLSLNNHESKTLSKLRDTLLPQLISGELRIPNAAK